MPQVVSVAGSRTQMQDGDTARFIVGQDAKGQWIAIEIHGRAGGLFRSRRDAMHYAEDESGHRPDAVLVSGEPIELRL